MVTQRDTMQTRPKKPLLLLGFLFIVLGFALFHISSIPTRRIGDGSTIQPNRKVGDVKQEYDNDVENRTLPFTKTIMTPFATGNQLSLSPTPDTPVDIMKDFGLYVRMYHGKRDDYFKILVPSMKYFWFLPVNLTVVLDDTPEDKKFGKEVANTFPFPKICYDRKFDPKYYSNKGYFLQQLSMFYVEECFDQKYVGFIDTDTLFVTSTTPELMFHRAKPIVLGHYGQPRFEWWKGTSIALGKKEVFTCMTYFPVVMKVEHLIALRRYVADLHNTSFLNVFRKFATNQTDFSQFSIMCNYMWYFHHDEYQFHAQIQSPREPYNNVLNAPGRQPVDYYQAHLTKKMLHPVPMSSMHFRHYLGHSHPRALPQYIQVGACFSGAFEWCPDLCKSIDPTALQRELFMFEKFDWAWNKHCFDVQRQHYMNIRTNYSEAVKPQILQWCQDVGKV